MGVQEKLTELAHVWEDIERGLIAADDGLATALPLAFRVEVVHEPGFLGRGLTKYLLLFNALEGFARTAGDVVASRLGRVEEEAHRHAQLWVEGGFGSSMDVVAVEKVSPSNPVRGVVCNRPSEAKARPRTRVSEPVPSPQTPVLDDEALGLIPEVVKRIELGESTIPDAEAGSLLADSLASTMVAVATGGPRIQAQDAGYRREHVALRAVLRRLAIRYPNPHNDLWSWYGQWREKLPTYQERRVYVSGLFDPVREALAARAAGHQELEPGVLPGSTGWAEVDEMLGKLRRRFSEAQDAEDFKAVGLLCHSIVTALGKVVFEPDRDTPNGEAEPGPDDAKRQIDFFLRRAASGSRFEHVRKIVSATYGQANLAKHRQTATKVDAGIAAHGALLLAQTLRLIAEEDEEAGNRPQSPADNDIPF